MPIVINELHIRVAVTTPPGEDRSLVRGGEPSGGASGGAREKDALVAECLERVFEILQKKSER
jgi:hypothetical protein